MVRERDIVGLDYRLRNDEMKRMGRWKRETMLEVNTMNCKGMYWWLVSKETRMSVIE